MSKIISYKRLVTIILLSLLLILAGIKILSVIFPHSSAKVADINLIDHNSRQIAYAELADKPKLVFFGFTHCPAICPAALANISAALDLAGDDVEDFHVMFVTTDPNRDKPAVLKSYVANFNESIVGYTGTKTELQKMYKKYYVYTQEAPEGKTEYDLNHSTVIYLVDEKGELLKHFEMGVDPEELAQAIKDN